MNVIRYVDNNNQILPNPGLEMMTQSPLLRVETSSPTQVTTPTPSPPPTAGKGGLTAYTPSNKLNGKKKSHLFKRKIHTVIVSAGIKSIIRTGNMSMRARNFTCSHN